MTHRLHPTIPNAALCGDTPEAPLRRPGRPWELVPGVSSCPRCEALQAAAERRQEAIAASRQGPAAPRRRAQLKPPEVAPRWAVEALRQDLRGAR